MPTATREPTQTRARTHGASGALRALVVAAVLLAAVLFGVSVLADGFIDDGSNLKRLPGEALDLIARVV